jgi:hypothetical protein
MHLHALPTCYHDVCWGAAVRDGGNVMRRVSGIISIAAVFWLAGCAIHPLPDDVTGVSTYNIVRQIRCEARQAVFEYAVQWLAGPKNPDLEAREIGRQFQEGLRPIHTLGPHLFKGEVRKLVQTFSTTGIAYNFQLQMLETNNVDPTTNLLTLNGRNPAMQIARVKIYEPSP